MSDAAQAFIAKARSLLGGEYLPKIERCLERLSDEEVWWRANEESNSIGNLLLHLSGNARQWIVSGVGRTADGRVRRLEFDRREVVPREELLRLVRQTLAEVDNVLARLDPARVLAVYAPDGTLAHVSPIRPLAATRLITRVRKALPGAAFAVEYDGDFGHEPAYPTWSFGEEAAEPVGTGTAGELLTRIPGRPVLKILVYHPTLPLDDFYERARRTAGSNAETTYSTGLSLVEFSAPRVTKATTLLA
jgi:hypothetical protein